MTDPSDGPDSSAEGRPEETPEWAADETEEREEAQEEESQDEVEGYRMTLLEHLVELRRRLIRCCIVILVCLILTFPFGEQIFDWLCVPAEGKFPADGGFVYTQVAEEFMTYLKVGIFGALLLALPFLSHQAWSFIAPGLYKRERRFVIPFVVLSSLLFGLGAAFCYYGIMPYAMDFFLSSDSQLATPQIKVSAYLSFITRMILAFGLVFNTPLVIFFLARMGLVTPDSLARFRRYAILIGFILAAMITPPDPGSQVAVALPFIVLYEIGILVARVFGPKDSGG
ncbi:MAG: twin-arginine translocase subunit TatC [Myxococcota bacterium]|nr:twin-arginine translocase subunit TatC [Myxococcota bacterium]